MAPQCRQRKQPPAAAVTTAPAIKHSRRSNHRQHEKNASLASISAATSVATSATAITTVQHQNPLPETMPTNTSPSATASTTSTAMADNTTAMPTSKQRGARRPKQQQRRGGAFSSADTCKPHHTSAPPSSRAQQQLSSGSPTTAATSSAVETETQLDSFPITKVTLEMKASLQNLQDALTCRLCEGILQKPSTISCSHTFCQSCLDAYSCNAYDCPVCKLPMTLKNKGAGSYRKIHPTMETMVSSWTKICEALVQAEPYWWDPLRPMNQENNINNNTGMQQRPKDSNNNEKRSDENHESDVIDPNVLPAFPASPEVFLTANEAQ